MRRGVVFTCLVVLAGLTGCEGENPYSTSALPVSGRVLSPSGEPLRGAEVVLYPKGKDGKVFGTEGSGMVGQDGSFSLKMADGREGVTGGYYVVVVRPYGDQKSADVRFAKSRIPEKYWSDESSQLTVEITEAKTNWEIRLTK